MDVSRELYNGIYTGKKNVSKRKYKVAQQYFSETRGAFWPESSLISPHNLRGDRP